MPRSAFQPDDSSAEALLEQRRRAAPAPSLRRTPRDPSRRAAAGCGAGCRRPWRRAGGRRLRRRRARRTGERWTVVRSTRWPERRGGQVQLGHGGVGGVDVVELHPARPLVEQPRRRARRRRTRPRPAARKAGVCALVGDARTPARRPQRQDAGQPPASPRCDDDGLAGPERRPPRAEPARPGERRRPGTLGQRLPVRGQRRDRVVDVDRHRAIVAPRRLNRVGRHAGPPDARAGLGSGRQARADAGPDRRVAGARAASPRRPARPLLPPRERRRRPARDRPAAVRGADGLVARGGLPGRRRGRGGAAARRAGAARARRGAQLRRRLSRRRRARAAGAGAARVPRHRVRRHGRDRRDRDVHVVRAPAAAAGLERHRRARRRPGVLVRGAHDHPPEPDRAGAGGRRARDRGLAERARGAARACGRGLLLSGGRVRRARARARRAGRLQRGDDVRAGGQHGGDRPARAAADGDRRRRPARPTSAPSSRAATTGRRSCARLTGRFASAAWAR